MKHKFSSQNHMWRFFVLHLTKVLQNTLVFCKILAKFNGINSAFQNPHLGLIHAHTFFEYLRNILWNERKTEVLYRINNMKLPTFMQFYVG